MTMNPKKKNTLDFRVPEPIIGGVCSYLGRRTTIKAYVWRALFVISAIPLGFIGLVIYVFMSLFIVPKDIKDQLKEKAKNKYKSSEEKPHYIDNQRNSYPERNSKEITNQITTSDQANESSPTKQVENYDSKNMRRQIEEIELLEIELEKKIKSLEEE